MHRYVTSLYHLLRYAIRCGLPPRALWPALLDLDTRELKLLSKRWYHDYSPLGLKTPQKGGPYPLNQVAKQEVLFRLISRVIELCSKESGSRSGVELFCADGFYANYALMRGASNMLGLDLSGHNLERARLAAKLLGVETGARFDQKDVFEIDSEFDFAICAGGLYHIERPEALLSHLHQHIRTGLVIQTVYSLAKTDPDYFESPAPGWTWGCRFSREFFVRMVSESGWRVLELETNELTGNDRPEDRGSIYALCERNAPLR